jgi:hypothetical protein
VAQGMQEELRICLTIRTTRKLYDDLRFQISGRNEPVRWPDSYQPFNIAVMFFAIVSHEDLVSV